MIAHGLLQKLTIGGAEKHSHQHRPGKLPSFLVVGQLSLLPIGAICSTAHRSLGHVQEIGASPSGGRNRGKSRRWRVGAMHRPSAGYDAASIQPCFHVTVDPSGQGAVFVMR
jgi:hypothetical protein